MMWRSAPSGSCTFPTLLGRWLRCIECSDRKGESWFRSGVNVGGAGGPSCSGSSIAVDDEAIGTAFLGGPVALAYARFDEPTRRSAEQQYLDSLTRYRTRAGSYRVPGEFVVAWATRPEVQAT